MAAGSYVGGCRLINKMEVEKEEKQEKNSWAYEKKNMSRDPSQTSLTRVIQISL